MPPLDELPIGKWREKQGGSCWGERAEAAQITPVCPGPWGQKDIWSLEKGHRTVAVHLLSEVRKWTLNSKQHLFLVKCKLRRVKTGQDFFAVPPIERWRLFPQPFGNRAGDSLWPTECGRVICNVRVSVYKRFTAFSTLSLSSVTRWNSPGWKTRWGERPFQPPQLSSQIREQKNYCVNPQQHEK